MKQDIFTFIEHEPVYVRVKRELGEAAREFSQNPRKFIADALRGDPTNLKRKRFMRVGATIAMTVWVLGSIVYIGYYYWKPAPVVVETDQLQKIADLTPLPQEVLQAPKKAQKAGGGGGGGKREMTPPSKGRLPKASMVQPQIVAPTSHPPAIKNPSLPVMPTIQVDPDLVPKQPANVPLGLPTGIPGPPSDGPGNGNGIGTGKGGGVGSGDGTGLGPGRGKGTGGGDYRDGGGDGIYTTGTAGVKSPQILAKEKPKYTEDARRDKIQGVVVLSAVFRKDGTISDIKVVRGLGYGLDEEAVKAAAKIRFVPGTKDGTAVNVRARLEFTFSLL